MEATAVEATLFIPLIILATTQLIKKAIPSVQGWLTIIVALLLGVLVAFVDTKIGVVPDINVAQGIVLGLGAIGISVAANKAGGQE